MFLNQPLIIADIIYATTDHRGFPSSWLSSEKYISALLYFEKITTGNATDDSWNISEDHAVQDTLAELISDHLSQNHKNPAIPDYIRLLFKHFCMKHTTPLFDNIEKIKDEMVPNLKRHFFDSNLTILSRADGLDTVVMSDYKIMRLFPEAVLCEAERIQTGTIL